jgi:hypothetical protein
VVPYNLDHCHPNNIDSLAEQTVYDDPALAWKRSWELDPEGHKYKGIDVFYVKGAAEKLGIKV